MATRRTIVNSLRLVFMCALMLCSPAMAKQLTVSIAQMPIVSENENKGVLIEFTKAIEKEAGVTIKREVVPFARSLDNVINRRADFHLPLIMNPDVDAGRLDFDFSTESIYEVNFVLYTNKNKPLDMNKLTNYKLESDRAHTTYFPFKVDPSISVESSMKKLELGRIDGFLFANVAVDPLIKELGLKNIHRTLYKVFEVKIVLPKGERGGDLDKLLSAAVIRIKQNGTHDKIMGPVYKPYQDWQP